MRRLLPGILLVGLALLTWPSDPEPVASLPSLAPAGRTLPGAEAPEDTFVSPWVSGRVMVSTDHAGAVAARHGAAVVRAAGPAGYTTLATPEGMDDTAFRALLAADPQVREAAPIGRIVGAGRKSTTTSARTATTATAAPTRAQPLQWHLDFTNAPYASVPATGVVVAVIDSGLAYATGSEDGRSFTAISSMSGVPIVHPWDFVEQNATPYDEHQHGTHIASLIASSGTVEGVAVGAKLMPVRVLDENNAGTEVALLDALAWARTHGAQVINLSLCFSPDYVPSGALVRALSEAVEAGIVIVGAAGNDGLDRVNYPAAHPGVIAVGAVAPASTTLGEVAWYSNYGARLDVMAPGGSTGADRTGDGDADGILAQTIYANDPSRSGLYFAVGTSQAAALVSGAAAHLIAVGADADTVRRTLQMGVTQEDWVGEPYADGFARGRLNVGGSRNLVTWGDTGREQTYHASVVGWLVDAGDGKVAPRVRVTVTDQDGGMVKDAQATISLYGPENVTLVCRTDPQEGVCTVDGPAVVPSASGDAWVAEVTGVLHLDIAYRPGALFHESDGLESVIAAMAENDAYAEALLAFRWSEGHDETLGDMVASVMVADMAADAYAPPRVTILSEALLTDATVLDEGSVDGSGLVTTPMFVPGGTGPDRYALYAFGTGLVTTPMLRMLVLPATSLEGTELGLSALSLYEGTGLVTTPMFAPVLLGRSTLDPLGASFDAGVMLEGSGVGETLLDGGWLVDDTIPSAVFLSSGVGGLGLYGESWDMEPVAL